MAGGLRARRRAQTTDYWPGFVDAMATLLLVIIFLLSIFMIAQFFLSQQLSGRDTVPQPSECTDQRIDGTAGPGTGDIRRTGRYDPGPPGEPV